MKRAGILFLSAFVAALILVSCSKVRRKPGWEFAPQMYEPVAYNPDQPNAAFADGRTAQLPPEGTVRAKETFYFPYSKDDSGFVAAGRAFVTNPIARTEATLAGAAARRSREPQGRALRRADHRLGLRSEEHTSELQSLMRISYAVFCLKKKKQT